MKAAIVFLVVALILGGLLGTLIVRDPGYVLVAYDGLTLETSLWFAVFAFTIVIVLVLGLLYFSVKLVRGTTGVSDWMRRRRESSARRQTVKGLLQMAEGQWAPAKKSLLAAVDRAETPLINYLNAARAAHELNNVDERDRLLSLAHETTPGARFAVGLTQAQLQQGKGQWEQCLATLIQLRKESARHPMVLGMLMDCYRELEDWDAVQEIVPELKKLKIGDPEVLALAQCNGWRARLEKTRASGEIASHAMKTWQQVPKELKSDPQLLKGYIQLLIDGNALTEAEELLRRTISRSWDDAWIRMYGLLEADVPKQVTAAEGWLKERPNNAELLLALGRLCVLSEAWGKAREYLEASLRQQRSPELYAELGRLCFALGETDRAGEYMLQAVALPALSVPVSPAA